MTRKASLFTTGVACVVLAALMAASGWGAWAALPAFVGGAYIVGGLNA